jgi:hypothetical protein
MAKKNELYFRAQWLDHLNQDEELKSRTSKDGESPSLDGKELVSLELKGLSKPCVIGLEKGKFYLKDKKADNPLVTIKMPLANFMKMAEDDDERFVWALLDDKTNISVVEGLTWPDIITIFELFIALQELLNKKGKEDAA